MQAQPCYHLLPLPVQYNTPAMCTDLRLDLTYHIRPLEYESLTTEIQNLMRNGMVYPTHASSISLMDILAACRAYLGDRQYYSPRCWTCLPCPS